MKLTQKQKVFCEEYIKTGNASDAARKAGYSPKTAPFIGAENLKKPQISAYIKSRLDEQDAALVADANEVLRFYSAVMRGEIRDQFGLDPSLADRIKAADSLAKRLAAAEGKPSADMAVKVIIDV
nr:MAG TPA: Terminase small subunit [Caudoviricetes sp.]